MHKHATVAHATMIFALVLALSAVALAADPHVGTWKVNLAKSKYNPGPAPKSFTVKFEAQDNGIKGVADSVNAEGQATHNEFAAKYDGKDYPFTGGAAAATIAFRRIDANTFDVVLKRDGIEMSSEREVFSKDGKTLTLTVKGKNTQGQAVNNTEVFDKH